MYNANTLKTELIGLIGWKQNADPSGWQLTDLTTSSSGLWFNGVHPLLTIDNLISICPRFDIIDSDSAAINTAFTKWLKEKTEDHIVKAIELWFTQKANLRTASNLLERNRLFSSTGNNSELIVSSGKIVGFQVDPIREQSIIASISSFSLHLTANQVLNVHLFKSGQAAPMQTESVDYTEAGSVQWFDVDWQLDGEGSYWLAYDQSDLVGSAIDGIRDFAINYSGFQTFPTAKYFKIAAFNADVDDSVLWDLSKNQYTTSTNYGLNLKLDVQCDYTQFIIDQQLIFKNVIALWVGMELLRELAFNSSSRINRNESNISSLQVLHAIDGDTQGRNDLSLSKQFKDGLNAIQFDTTGIEKTCLPCRKRGIRNKVIGPR